MAWILLGSHLISIHIRFECRPSDISMLCQYMWLFEVTACGGLLSSMVLAYLLDRFQETQASTECLQVVCLLPKCACCCVLCPIQSRPGQVCSHQVNSHLVIAHFINSHVVNSPLSKIPSHWHCRKLTNMEGKWEVDQVRNGYVYSSNKKEINLITEQCAFSTCQKSLWESQLDPGFFPWIYFLLCQQNIDQHHSWVPTVTYSKKHQASQ